MTVAVMKKDENRKFSITAYDGEKVTMIEQVEGATSKSVAIKTFKRAYKVVEGELEMTTEATEEPTTSDNPDKILEAKENSPEVVTDPLPESFGEEIDDAIMIIKAGGGRLMKDSFLPAEIPIEETLTVLPTPPPANIKAEPHLPSHMRSVLDPTRKLEEWEEKPQIGNGWDLTPTYASPLIGEAQKPMLEQTDVHSANSMRANRENEAIPFTPNPFFLRQSMISSYLQCPDKFYDTYENGYGEDTIFTKTGTAIHGIMEDYYKDPQNANIDELFETWWRSHSTPEWDWYRDWKVMVNAYFEKQKNKPHPQIIALEFEFQTEVNGIPVSGTIDRIDRIDAKTIKIVDYKTNFQPFSDLDLQESTQFKMYSVVLKRLKDIIGDFDKVICEYDMLRLGYTQEVTYSDDDLGEYEKWMAMIWGKMLDGRDRKPQLNQYCSFCQKRATCSVYKEQLEAPISQILTENTDLDTITTERERLAMVKKMVDNRIKEIDGTIKTVISENAGEITIGDYIWSTNSSTRTAYPSKTVIRILTMHDMVDKLPDIVNVGVTNMKSLLKDHPQVMEEIVASATVSYTAPTLSKRKVKPVKAKKE